MSPPKSPDKSPEKKKTQQSDIISYFIFDDFAAHLCNRESMELPFKHKILSMKEEGDSSHVNQTYDQFVAKNEKKKGVVADITVKEIKVILVCVYKVEPPKGNKIKQVKALEEEIKKDRPRLFGNEETNLEQTLPLPQAAQQDNKKQRTHVTQVAHQEYLERAVGSAVNL